jgi:hypothetical protein
MGSVLTRSQVLHWTSVCLNLASLPLDFVKAGLLIDEIVLSSYSFAELESIAALCLMVMCYRIEVTDDPKFSSETFEQRKERVLKADMGSILLRPVKVPLTFKRR